jgi:hypothetical protein
MSIEAGHSSYNEKKYLDEQDSEARIWIRLAAWVDESGLRSSK